MPFPWQIDSYKNRSSEVTSRSVPVLSEGAYARTHVCGGGGGCTYKLVSHFNYARIVNVYSQYHKIQILCVMYGIIALSQDYLYTDDIYRGREVLENCCVFQWTETLSEK